MKTEKEKLEEAIILIESLLSVSDLKPSTFDKAFEKLQELKK
jgi:hypothetical protein